MIKVRISNVKRNICSFNMKECNNTHYIQFDIITLIDNTYFVRIYGMIMNTLLPISIKHTYRNW